MQSSAFIGLLSGWAVAGRADDMKDGRRLPDVTGQPFLHALRNRPARIIARIRRRNSPLRFFLRRETLGGLLLMVAAAAGLATANSPAAAHYIAAREFPLGPFSVLHWVNDGLMAVFFLLAGLEMKRELAEGRLSTWRGRALPGLAALGGMILPAAFYLAVTWTTPALMRGWAIPAATDIAFTLGVLALLGRSVPLSLKVFVTALAIVDDVGAVLVIAVFYSTDLHWPWIGAAGGIVVVLLMLNRSGVRRLGPYLLGGLLLWLCVQSSGVHASVAGVVLALMIPLVRSRRGSDAESSPLHRLEQAIHPWVAFAIVPAFGFANAGVLLRHITPEELLRPVTLGVILGLVIGKPLGVFALAWMSVRLGWADRPARTSWAQLYGASTLCGIGFTMSLFIGLLAFPTSPALQHEAKLGVLAGSLLSAALGALILLWTGRRRERRPLPVG